MNTNHSQQPSNLDEILISYLDGELPVEQEDALFSNLAANNEDIRSTMRDMINIRSAVQSDLEAFTPPPAAQEAVFASLGMRSASITPQAQQSSWKKALLPIIFLASGLAGGYGISEYNTNNERGELVDLMKSVHQYPQQNALISTGISPTVPTIVLEKKAPVKIVYRDRVMNVASVTPMITLPPIAVQQKADQQPLNSEKEQSINNQIVQQDIAIPAVQEVKPAAAIEQTPIATLNENISNIQNIYPQFWTQIRSISALQAPAFSGVQSANSITDNIRLTFAYSFGENFAIGMEGGREQFVLSYNGINSQDRPITYNQISPMLTGGLYVQGRTNQLSFLNGARVFASGFIGGSEIGLLGRIGAGLMYPITNNVSVTAGIEQSQLNFQYQGNSFTTKKLDLLYGISISF